MNYKVGTPLTLNSSTGVVGLNVDENTFKISDGKI